MHRASLYNIVTRLPADDRTNLEQGTSREQVIKPLVVTYTHTQTDDRHSLVYGNSLPGVIYPRGKVSTCTAQARKTIMQNLTRSQYLPTMCNITLNCITQEPSALLE